MDIEEQMQADIAGRAMRFPPFPEPPAGVTILSFEDFKPTGIQMTIAGEDQVEIDGLGVPTLELRVKHNADGSDEKQSKKRKRKKKNAFSGLQKPWWEVWEEGESLRNGNYDLDAPNSDRLFQASHDFIQQRPWPLVNEGLRNLWDQFRLYIGLMSHPVQPPSRKQAKAIIQSGVDNGDLDEDEEAYSDDEMPNATAGPVQMEDIPENEEDLEEDADLQKELEEREINRIFKKRQDTEEQRRDSRFNDFLRDPGLNIRIFLSSYFREAGLIWSEPRCRDAPRLLLFWLKYMLRSRAFDASVDGQDMIKSLQDAVKTSEIAKLELPASHQIARALPCQFSKGCIELWGTRTKTWADMEHEFGDKSQTAAATVASSEDDDEDAKRRKLDLDEMDDEQQFKKELADSGVELVDASRDIDLNNLAAKTTVVEDDVDAQNAKVDANTARWGDASGGWGNTGEAWISPSLADVPGMREWAKSSSAPVVAPWMGANGGADADAPEQPMEPPEAESNPWDHNDPANQSDWDTGPKESLLPILGPSVFPRTHETGVVEWSTRRIARLEPASPAIASFEGLSTAEVVEEDLSRRLGKVVLEPWLGWDKNEKSDITKPVILPKSRGKVILTGDNTDGEEGGHNPLKDDITLLVDPAVLDKLVVGMGLGATWIQIVPQEDGAVSHGRGPLGGYWYAEQVMHILPSFHMEA